MTNGNGNGGFNKRRNQLLLYGGLSGIFIYMMIIEFLTKPFHFEFILGFLAMMGVSIAQGVDKK